MFKFSQKDWHYWHAFSHALRMSWGSIILKMERQVWKAFMQLICFNASFIVVSLDIQYFKKKTDDFLIFIKDSGTVFEKCTLHWGSSLNWMSQNFQEIPAHTRTWLVRAGGYSCMFQGFTVNFVTSNSKNTLCAMCISQKLSLETLISIKKSSVFFFIEFPKKQHCLKH